MYLVFLKSQVESVQREEAWFVGQIWMKNFGRVGREVNMWWMVKFFFNDEG